MKRLRILYKFVVHFITARNTKGFGVHSPFVFQFIKLVLCDESSYYIFTKIESIRSELKLDRRYLNTKDFGTGIHTKKTISNIAKCSLKSPKEGQLFFRIINYFKAKNVLELGTSLGITTLYLASSSADIQCISLEGCPETANVAIENIKKSGLDNIKIVVGNIDKTLMNVLRDTEKIDFVFIDSNHRYNSVIQYFEQCLKNVHSGTIMIIDDIYWSADMEKAWKRVKDYPEVKTTIDLFHFGIIFFNSDLHKKHYKMRY